MNRTVKGWDRELCVKFYYDSVTKIPQIGKGWGYVNRQCDLAARDTKSRYDTGDTSPKPGTLIDLFAATTSHDIMLKYNPNGIGGGDMFKGCFRREKDVISMIASLLGKSQDNPFLDAGFILSGGTESLNQALLMYRNKFFSEVLGQNVRTMGVAQAVFNAAQQNKDRFVRPRILAPVNYHFSVARAAELFGLGVESIVYYGLDENFDIDQKNLEEVVNTVYSSGDDFIAALVCGGDTTHGKVHDPSVVHSVITQVRNRDHTYIPPIIVDCAGTYQFIGLMKESQTYTGKLPKVGFDVPGVSALYGDLHKQEMPYGCSVLLLKDYCMMKYSDLRTIACVPYLDSRVIRESSESEEVLKEEANIFCTIPASRSGANIFAAWAYYVGNGIQELRKRKEKIWSLVQRFAAWVRSSEHYELVVEPQTQIVAFGLKGTSTRDPEIGKKNQLIYEQVKNSQEDALHISQDDALLVRTPEELARSASSSAYKGLFATFMEHNNEEGLKKLEDRLETLAVQTKRFKQAEQLSLHGLGRQHAT